MGCVADKGAVSIVLEGLNLLEYRGYDSTGIATLYGDELRLRKKEGRLSSLLSSLTHGDRLGSACIGHTRWATHGKPCDENAHPFLSDDGHFALVHNGVIENYLELKKFLLSKGFRFTSETDSEVIVDLIQFHYDGSVLHALARAVRDLKGSFAIAVLSSYEKEKIFFAKKDNPLVLGVENRRGYVCSDIPGISKYVRECVIPDDYRLGYVDKENVFTYDFSLNPVSTIKTTLCREQTYSLGGYSHYMEKEIAEIPDSVQRALRSYRKSFSPDVIHGMQRLVFVGCGTAYHAGLVAKRILRERVPLLDCYCVTAGELPFEKYPVGNTLFVAISQSGETADTLNAVKKIKSDGGKVLAVCNVPSSSIVREADEVILTDAGIEIAVASTKAYNSQLAVLISFCIDIIRYYGKGDVLSNDLACETLSLPDLAASVLQEKETIASIAKENVSCPCVFYLGRGLDFCIACEGSLKLKEISYLHSEAFTAGELKHGTLALIEKGTLIVAFVTQSKMIDKMATCLSEVRSRGAKIFVITKFQSEKISSLCDYIVHIPETDDILSPILAVIPAQAFAYYSALYRGKDIDKPRNLAKSVTVE